MGPFSFCTLWKIYVHNVHTSISDSAFCEIVNPGEGGYSIYATLLS
jgi:hypothetical protein